MKIAEWAELCLNSPKIEDKLMFPEDIDWEAWQPLRSIPKEPGRPNQLRFSQSGERTKFPSLHHLEQPSVRGQVLHFFANHELLALELMALTILKFPDAPHAFLQGIVNTLKDEQKHLRLYLQKMHEHGVEFGEVSVNDFFWKTLAHAKTPLEYTTGMALTFEQANLDFSLFYQKAFEKIGDTETAEILNQVYVDEISHVAYGVYWFDKLRPAQSDFWEEYSSSLQFPLTPQRAKGKNFDQDSRLRAGLSQEFVNKLKLYSHSKGRMPDVFYFNPDCEDQWALGKSYNPGKKTQLLKEDLETLPAFLGHSSDIVLVERKPEPSFLKALHRAGVDLPEFQLFDSHSKKTSHQRKDLKKNQRKVRSLQPWGHSPDTKKRFDSLSNRFEFYQDCLSTSRELFSKTWSVGLLKNFLETQNKIELITNDEVGVICTDYQGVLTAAKQFIDAGHERIVIKAPFGASGRNFQWIDASDLSKIAGHDSENPDAIEKWALKTLKKQGELVVEPWLKKEFDYSLQIQVAQNGEASIAGLARFLVNERGGYRGALLGGFHTGLSTEVLRFLNRDGREQNFFKKFNEDLAAFVAAEAQKACYSGPIGIDAFVFRDLRGALKIKPIVETNCRWNMGRLVVELEKSLNLRGVGLWQVIPYNQGYIDKVVSNFSPLDRQPHRRGHLANGKKVQDDDLFSYLIATPSYNKSMVALLLTGPSLEKLYQKIDHLTVS